VLLAFFHKRLRLGLLAVTTLVVLWAASGGEGSSGSGNRLGKQTVVQKRGTFFLYWLLLLKMVILALSFVFS
jgi:hypothetical protein